MEFNPILGELIMHEQMRERLREAERQWLIQAAMAPRPAHRPGLRTIAGQLLIAVRHLFNASASAS